MGKEQIIIVTPYRNSFIDNDINILSENFTVLLNDYKWKQKYLYPIYMIRQLIFLLVNINRTKKIVIQFGGYWAVLPVLFGKVFKKPTAIILHGTDCAIIQSISYGSMRKKLVKKVCRFSYKHASLLLPVSSSLIYSEHKYTDFENIQGIQYFFPEIQTATKVIHNGLDTEFWIPLKETHKEENRFLAVFSQNQFYLKGGDLLIKIAKKFPNHSFYIAGCKESSEISYPENVYFLGKLSKEDLLIEYNKAQYYFQLSIFEGFGLSLCEAMLCNCIPIVSSVNALPYIVDNSGFVLEKKDQSRLEEIISKVIQLSNKKELGILARKRIVENFSLEKRSSELTEAIKNI